MDKRIYVVKNALADSEQLVEANSQAQALRIAINGLYTVEAAGAKDVARLMAAGGTLLTAQAGE